MTVRRIANDLAPQLDLDGTWEFDTGATAAEHDRRARLLGGAGLP